jgi:hypothetical protein
MCGETNAILVAWAADFLLVKGDEIGMAYSMNDEEEECL